MVRHFCGGYLWYIGWLVLVCRGQRIPKRRHRQAIDIVYLQGAIVLAYPEHKKRGRYLAIWLAFKNSGQIVGGYVGFYLFPTIDQF